MAKLLLLFPAVAALRSAPLGSRSGFAGSRLVANMGELRDTSFEKTTSAKMTTSMPPFLKKLGIEKPEDGLKLIQEKAAELDLDAAKSFATKNLDVIKGSQEKAIVDVLAAAFTGLLFSGAYGAVVFALGWFVAAPSTAARASASSVRRQTSD